MPNEALARAQARLAQLKAGAAVATKTVEKGEEKEKVIAAPAVTAKEESGYDPASNPIYKIVKDTSLSNKEKIEKTAKYLTAENEDYDTARKRMLDFELYFAHDQAERTKLDEESIQKLIDELESATKSEVHKIVEKITEVQTGSKRITQLLEVLRTARLDGKSIEQISAALKYNDRLVSEISDLNRTLVEMQAKEKSAEEQEARQLDRKTQSHAGLSNKFARWLGEDRGIASAIQFAADELARAKENVEKTQALLKEKGEQRDTNLESGKLTILRSIDATEKGFTQEIVNTAKKALELIGSIRTSTQILLEKNAHSREAAVETGKRIDEAKIRETILGSAVQQALAATHEQGKTIKGVLDNLDAEIVEAGEDSVDGALKKVERTERGQKHSGAMTHEEALGKMKNDFKMLEADNTTAEAKAKQFSSLVAAHFDLFSNIQKRVLPTTARALKMGLEQDYAMGVGELGQIINASAEMAREINADNLKGLTTAQDEMRNAELARIDAMYKEVMDAQTIVTETIDKIVQFGADSAERQGRLSAATDSLRQVGEAFNEIGALVSDRSKSAGSAPATPAAANDQPGRPGSAFTPKGTVSAPQVA